MSNRFNWNDLLKIIVILISGLVALACIYLSFYLKFMGDIQLRNFQAFEANYLFIYLGFLLISILFNTYDFYNKMPSDLFFFSFLTELCLTVYMMALSYAGGWIAFPRSVILINLLVGTFGLFFWNLGVFGVYHYIRGQKKILVIGPENNCLEAVRNFDLMKNRRHEVTHVALSNYYKNVCDLADQVDIVYLTGHIEEKERLKIYDYLMDNNKKLFLSTTFENLMMVNPNIMSFEDESIIEVSPFKISNDQEMIKRLFDILVSLSLVLLTSPIMLIIAICIKIDSPGPIFYKQERITKNNRPFNVLKFRSMAQDAEKHSGPVLASSRDSRVTRVGKFIRSTRIDELPQLLNVLKGDMSLVGPRPERPHFVNQYQEENAYYNLRHHVRAGITGYAQVYGKYSTDFNSKLNFDLLYIKDYSLLFDFKLLFQTVKILFDKVSSQGLDEENQAPAQWEDYEDRVMIIR